MFPSSVEQENAPPKHPLKNLLDRIRSQRSQWLETPAELPGVTTEELPEKDTTIHTGSLTSGEKSNVLPAEPLKTGHQGKVPAPFMLNVSTHKWNYSVIPETSERSTDAETQPPDERLQRQERLKWVNVHLNYSVEE